jgi:uncharacterized membrane protein YuzA (DUF378 family)
LDKQALTLIIIGALNWGLIGLFQLDLIAVIFGGRTGLFTRMIYMLIGLAGLYGIALLFTEDKKVN